MNNQRKAVWSKLGIFLLITFGLLALSVASLGWSHNFGSREGYVVLKDTGWTEKLGTYNYVIVRDSQYIFVISLVIYIFMLVSGLMDRIKDAVFLFFTLFVILSFSCAVFGIMSEEFLGMYYYSGSSTWDYVTSVKTLGMTLDSGYPMLRFNDEITYVPLFYFFLLWSGIVGLLTTAGYFLCGNQKVKTEETIKNS